MKIDYIISDRKYQNHFALQIVYEWEDIFAKLLNVPFIYESRTFNILDKAKMKFRIPLFYIPFFVRKKNVFKFDLIAKTRKNFYSRKGVIPLLIDFFVTKDELPLLEETYKKCNFILVSSKEADEFLSTYQFGVTHFHLALSLPDKYRINSMTSFEKKYDLVLMGRPNHILQTYLDRYCKENPSFRYIGRKNVNGKLGYYLNDDTFVGSYSSREEYLSLLQSSKVSFYSTPGIDGGEVRTNGYNQVTPRFLELIACGCHIIARYKNNSDTDYYRLREFCSSVNSYQEFKNEMQWALTNKVDMEKYAAYLENHYTSKRVDELKLILNRI